MTPRASVSDVNLLIRGGYVLTMDSAVDIPGGDVHVHNGVIQATIDGARSLDLGAVTGSLAVSVSMAGHHRYENDLSWLPLCFW